MSLKEGFVYHLEHKSLSELFTIWKVFLGMEHEVFQEEYIHLSQNLFICKIIQLQS